MITSHRLSISTVALLIGIGTAPALAQTTASDTVTTTPQNVSSSTSSDTNTMQSGAVDRVVDRDLNQEQRIEQGLKSGALTDKEAARLENGEAKIDRLESADMNNGQLSAQDAAQIQHDQNAESMRIKALESNNVTGTPNTTSTDRLEADVQRDVNQQARIDKGIDNGSLTAAEVGNLENGQAHMDRDEAGAGRNGFVSLEEQNRIQTAEDFQSGDIYNDKHNKVVATSSNGMGSNSWQDKNGFDRHDGFDYGDRSSAANDGDHDWDNHGMYRVNLSDGDNDQNDHPMSNHNHADMDRKNHDHFTNQFGNMGDNDSVPLATGNATAVSPEATTPSSTSVTAGTSTSVSGSSSAPMASPSASTSVTAGATAPVATTPVATPHVAPPVVVPHAPVIHAHK